MAVRQFNRKRRKPRSAGVRKAAAPKATMGPATRLKSKRSRKGAHLPIPTFAGRHKPIDGREAALTVLQSMQSFASALLEVESLMWTVHRGHAKAITNLSTVGRAVLRAATELKRTLR